MDILNKIQRSYKSFKTGIKNIFYYLPIVYRDRQWDSHYIYFILLKKLQRQEKFFLSNNAMSVESKDTAKEIRLVINCLQRLYDNMYLHEISDYFEYDKKFGHIPYITIDKTPNEQGLYPAIFTENEKQKELFGRCASISDLWREKDKDFVFDYMKEKVEGWWN